MATAPALHLPTTPVPTELADYGNAFLASSQTGDNPEITTGAPRIAHKNLAPQGRPSKPAHWTILRLSARPCQPRQSGIDVYRLFLGGPKSTRTAGSPTAARRVVGSPGGDNQPEAFSRDSPGGPERALAPIDAVFEIWEPPVPSRLQTIVRSPFFQQFSRLGRDHLHAA